MINQEEETIVTIRPHIIFLVWPFLVMILTFGIVVLVFLRFGASLWFSLFFFLWLFLSGGFFLYRLVNWYLNQYIFTTKRVIVKEQTGLFRRLTTEARLNEIGDISYQTNGLWAMLFNFGDIFISTSVSDQPIVIPDIGQPGQIKEELLGLKEQYGRKDDQNQDLNN
jgi:hypothetical protein